MADEQRVRRLVDDLLAAHPPDTTGDTEFWGARFDAGLAWVGFPPGCGGLGIAPGLQGGVEERLAEAGAPSNWVRNPVGLGAVAAALVGYGTAAQQRRWLRPLFTCDEVWCQLYTEPEAGSDLASLTTAAHLTAVGGRGDAGVWSVTGHKRYSTLAHVARWGLLLARTHPERPRHRGLTCFAVDLSAPGVEVRPLRQLDGDTEFDEVVLAGVEVPDDQRIGPPAEGWAVAVTTLLHERLALAGPPRVRGGGPVAEAVRLWHGRDHDEPDLDPVLRDRVAAVWIEAEVTRLLVASARASEGAGPPGPEAAAAKLAMAECDQRVWDLCVDLMGPEGSLYDDWAVHAPAAAGESRRDPRRAWLHSRALTIQGGTAEILRTILAERALGLPPEPRSEGGGQVRS